MTSIFSTQFSQKSDLPDSVFVVMAASGNPSTILADQLLRQSEISEVRLFFVFQGLPARRCHCFIVGFWDFSSLLG
ncbi:unnamed protein product [Taenia asiatica]|uniref:Formyl_trans_N domain-containing protein n=1 Tax=Taenia asiatica TaxID=60517 RepID=A0A0R3W782_TAEAS|nr:unnamed protein product [Taenia asiatica]